MKTFTYIITLLFFINASANYVSDTLQIEKEGFIVSVVDFQEGDEIKLFEAETMVHVLSKTRGQVDLSMLPAGKYLLENNEGKSVIIEKGDQELIVDQALTDEYVVNDSQFVDNKESYTTAEELNTYYTDTDSNLLDISREGDKITVLDFEEGDRIKLFEVKNTVHILTKSSYTVDLSQLPDGVYVLKNNRGKSIVVEKFSDDNQIADM